MSSTQTGGAGAGAPSISQKETKADYPSSIDTFSFETLLFVHPKDQISMLIQRDLLLLKEYGLLGIETEELYHEPGLTQRYSDQCLKHIICLSINIFPELESILSDKNNIIKAELEKYNELLVLLYRAAPTFMMLFIMNTPTKRHSQSSLIETWSDYFKFMIDAIAISDRARIDTPIEERTSLRREFLNKHCKSSFFNINIMNEAIFIGENLQSVKLANILILMIRKDPKLVENTFMSNCTLEAYNAYLFQAAWNHWGVHGDAQYAADHPGHLLTILGCFHQPNLLPILMPAISDETGFGTLPDTIAKTLNTEVGPYEFPIEGIKPIDMLVAHYTGDANTLLKILSTMHLHSLGALGIYALAQRTAQLSQKTTAPLTQRHSSRAPRFLTSHFALLPTKINSLEMLNRLDLETNTLIEYFKDSLSKRIPNDKNIYFLLAFFHLPSSFTNMLGLFLDWQTRSLDFTTLNLRDYASKKVESGTLIELFILQLAHFSQRLQKLIEDNIKKYGKDSQQHKDCLHYRVIVRSTYAESLNNLIYANKGKLKLENPEYIIKAILSLLQQSMYNPAHLEKLIQQLEGDVLSELSPWLRLALAATEKRFMKFKNKIALKHLIDSFGTIPIKDIWDIDDKAFQPLLPEIINHFGTLNKWEFLLNHKYHTANPEHYTCIIEAAREAGFTIPIQAISPQWILNQVVSQTDVEFEDKSNLPFLNDPSITAKVFWDSHLIIHGKSDSTKMIPQAYWLPKNRNFKNLIIIPLNKIDALRDQIKENFKIEAEKEAERAAKAEIAAKEKAARDAEGAEAAAERRAIARAQEVIKKSERAKAAEERRAKKTADKLSKPLTPAQQEKAQKKELAKLKREQQKAKKTAAAERKAKSREEQRQREQAELKAQQEKDKAKKQKPSLPSPDLSTTPAVIPEKPASSPSTPPTSPDSTSIAASVASPPSLPSTPQPPVPTPAPKQPFRKLNSEALPYIPQGQKPQDIPRFSLTPPAAKPPLPRQPPLPPALPRSLGRTPPRIHGKPTPSNSTLMISRAHQVPSLAALTLYGQDSPAMAFINPQNTLPRTSKLGNPSKDAHAGARSTISPGATPWLASASAPDISEDIASIGPASSWISKL